MTTPLSPATIALVLRANLERLGRVPFDTIESDGVKIVSFPYLAGSLVSLRCAVATENIRTIDVHYYHTRHADSYAMRAYQCLPPFDSKTFSPLELETAIRMGKEMHKPYDNLLVRLILTPTCLVNDAWKTILQCLKIMHEESNKL